MLKSKHFNLANTPENIIPTRFSQNFQKKKRVFINNSQLLQRGLSIIEATNRQWTFYDSIYNAQKKKSIYNSKFPRIRKQQKIKQNIHKSTFVSLEA